MWPGLNLMKRFRLEVKNARQFGSQTPSRSRFKTSEFGVAYDLTGTMGYSC